MAKKPSKADVFDVWGAPPLALTKGMTPQQVKALRRYTELVTDKAYRLAYDNGVSHGLAVVSLAAQKEWRKQIGAR